VNKKILQQLFKKISYFFFSKIYGKVVNSISWKNNNQINVKISDLEKDLKYKVYTIFNGRMYTDRIHDTAILLDNKIIDGPSFQLRDNYNSPAKDNIVFEKGTPRKLIKLKGTVLLLLTGGGGNSNYWHWLYDVLPRIKIYENTEKLDQVDYLLLPSLKKKFQIETLNLLNITKQKVLSSEKFRHIKADKLVATDHPYILTNNFHQDAQNIPMWIINWLKENFIEKEKLLIQKYPKKIFLDRDDTNPSNTKIRSLINENEVKDYLIKNSFKCIKPSELSFKEQVNYFNNAEFIIGLHGAAFANISFCKKNTKVIEFRMEKTGKVIENLAKQNSLVFDSIVCKVETPDYDKQSGNIKVSLKELDKKINDI